MHVFNINKPFPFEEGKVLVSFDQDFVAYGYRGLEYKLFSDELDFLTRFKKMRYDGGILSSQDLFRVRFGKRVKALLEHDRPTLFIDENPENRAVYHFDKGAYETLVKSPITDELLKYCEDAYKLHGTEAFVKFIDGYKLDNIFNTKIMQVYNSNYFNNYFYSSNAEIKDLDIEQAINEDMDNRNSYEYYGIE